MRTLLVVDDEKLMADGLSALLATTFAGRLQVLHCYSARQAVEIAAQTPVDLLVTDINMPDRSGLELHAELAQIRPEMQVIYLTGYSEFEYARTAVDQHAFAYVLKGEGDEVVISAVERVLSLWAEEDRETAPPPREAEKDTGEEAPEWMGELHAYIHAHLSEDLSLNRLAEFCHFHPVYLSRAYREATGSTLTDYIGGARLNLSRKLLRESRMSIGEIARCTGFATDNYFCRWFRKQTGMSPQSFRQKRN